MQAPRRRADDWRDTSLHSMDARWFTELCTSLGYDAANVMSVRLNAGEAVVTWEDQAMGGMPRSTRHPIIG